MSSLPASGSQRVSLTSATAPKDFGRLWDDALQRYRVETGNELLTLPVVKDCPSHPRSADEIVAHFEKQEKAFSAFRANGEKIRGVLKPVVDIVLFLGKVAEGASNTVPGGEIIFGAVGVLLQATKGVSGLYNAIESLFDRIKRYLERVALHLPKLSATAIPPTPALVDVLVDTLVQVFAAIAIMTKYCNSMKRDTLLKTIWRTVSRRTSDYLRVLSDRDDVKEVLSKLESLAKHEIEIAVASIYASVREAERLLLTKELRSWLRAPSPEPTEYQRKRKLGSCQWFFDDQFQDWTSCQNGIYWVYGRAGTGKSVLCSSVIDKLKNDASLRLLYFYFDFNDPEKQDCRGLVSSLVFQLGISSEYGIQYLKEQRYSYTYPVYEDALIMLSRLLPLSGRTFIVIDALDECPEYARDSDLLSLLEYLSRMQKKGDVNIHVLVASRPEPDIRARMPRIATHLLDFNETIQHMDDISKYIHTELHRPDTIAYSGWSDETKEHVQTCLINRSNGIFLWVKLQLQSLRRCAPGDVYRVLDELPPGLNATYERILQAFGASRVSIDRIRRVFECVAFAKRPLFPAEVVDIFSMNFDSPLTDPLTFDSQSETHNAVTFILDKCPSLIEIVSDSRFGGKDVIQFIHLSVKEFLTSEWLRNATSESSVHLYALDKERANLTIARMCLSALDMKSPPSHFREYANGFWTEHVSCHMDDSIGDLLFGFLSLGSASLDRWVKEGSGHGDRFGTALHYAALLGLCHHAKRILEHPRSASFTSGIAVARTRNSQGQTALHVAANVGSSNVARRLLAYGALVDDIDASGNIPLHEAVSQGRECVIRLLLEHPAADGSGTAALQLRARNHDGLTILHQCVAETGDAEICRLLLEYGAPIEDVDIHGNTSLHLAVQLGKLHILDLLLQYPVHCSDTTSAVVRCRIHNHRGETALHSAVFATLAGPSSCRYLLEHCSALINDTDHNGDTPLHHAAASGKLLVVKILLECSVTDGSDGTASPCRARNERGMTALHSAAAAPSCTSDICRILLEYGALIVDGDVNGDTPLHGAAAVRDYDTVKLFLEHPAADEFDTSSIRARARNYQGQTPLHIAASRGHDDICRLLLEKGAPIESTDNNGNTPLSLARARPIPVRLRGTRRYYNYNNLIDILEAAEQSKGYQPRNNNEVGVES